MNKNKQNWITQSMGDRFIPTLIRPCAFQVQSELLKKQRAKTTYEDILEKNILEPRDSNPFTHKIMTFGTPPPTRQITKTNKHHPSATLPKDCPLEPNGRKINKLPYKTLQAPNLQDDFYLNLLDWSQRNQIAVALDCSLYLWSGCSSEVNKLYETCQLGDYLCSVAFCEDHKVSIGNTLGQIKIFDITKKKKLNQFDGHTGRVGSLSWSSGLLASGSRDGTVATWDLRDGLVTQYKAHSQQICGLRWSPQGNFIASGGNDNKLVIYSEKKGGELIKFHEHKAAVKAIGWCPSNPSLLASGGGTADRHIRFFSIQTLKQNHCIDTGSQVCNLTFSRISNEMITTHGYSLNQVNLWNTLDNWENRSVRKVTTLTGHTYRVLYLAVSPSGESILTGAGDETLRFWNVFNSSHYKKEEQLEFQVDLR